MKRISSWTLAWSILTLTITAIIILATIFSLKAGITDIFPYFYILPLVILALTQPRVAIYFTIVLGWLYLGLVYYYGPNDTRLFAASTAWFYVFVSIGIVISSLSDRLRVEQKFRDIFSNSQAGIFTFDTTGGKIIEINEKAGRIFGYTPEEIRKIRIFEILGTGPGEAFLSRLIAERQVGDAEMLLRKKDGTPLWALLSASLDKDQFATCSVIDITDRKNAAEILFASEERYRLLLQNVNDAVIVHEVSPDGPGRIIEVNDRACQMLGYSREEFVGLAITDLDVPEQRERMPAIAGELLSSGHSVFTTDFFTREKTRVPVEVSSRLFELHGRSTVLAVARDITERKKMEDALRESEEWFRHTIQLTRCGITIIDATSHEILVANKKALEMIGGTESEIIGVDCHRFICPAECRKCPVRDPGPPVDQSEWTLLTQSGEKIPIIRSIARTTMGGREVLIESFVDISVQKRAEQKMIESSRFLTAMMDTIPIPIFYKGVDGRYLGCNPRFEEYIGIPRKELIGKSVYDIAPPELAEKYHAADQQVLDNPVPQQYETEVRFADGSGHNVIFYKAPFFTNEGRVGGLIGGFLDITERKRAEERLSEVNSVFLAFGPDPLSNINRLTGLAGRVLNGTCALFNRLENGMLCSLGTWNTPPDFPSCDFPEGHICNDVIQNAGSSPVIISDLMSSSYADTDPNVMRYHLQTYVGIPVKIGEKSLGSLCVVYQDRYSPSRQEIELLSFLAQAIAIEDERRTGMQELRDSEDKFRTLFNNAADMITLHEMMPDGRPGRYVEVNDEGIRRLQYSHEEFLSLSPSDIVAPEARWMMKSPADQISSEGRATFEIMHLAKGGRRIPVEVRAHRFEFKGKPMVLALIRDITDRKHAEEELRKSRSLLEDAMDKAQMAYWEHDAATGLFTFNDRFYALYGTTALQEGGYQMPAEVYAREFVHPEDRDMVAAEAAKSAEATDPAYASVIEHRIIRRDGEVRHIVVRIGITKDAEGRTIRSYGATQDITDRKSMEDALRVSEEKYRGIIENIQDIFYRSDENGKLVMVSPSGVRIFGYDSEEEILGKDIATTFYPDPKDRLRILEAFREQETLQNFTVTLKRHDSTPGIFSVNAHRYYDKEGHFRGVEGILTDITDQKRAEEALRQSEEKYRTLVESSDDAIFIVDREHRVLYTNNVMPARLGTTADTMIGRRMLDFERPEIMEAKDALLRTVFETREQVRTDFLLDQPGNPQWVDLTLLPIRDKSGEFTTVLGVAHDITHRKVMEESLALSVKEKEMMIKEIHHRVRNNLQIMESLISLQERPIHDPAILHEIHKIKNRIGMMALVHGIAYEYDTPDSINVLHLLRKAASRIVDTPEKGGKIVLSLTARDAVMPLITSVPFGLIITELLTNSVQHAFPGEMTGSITIDFLYNEKDYVLNYSDSGTGFPGGTDPYAAKSGGLFLIRGLVRQLGGTLSYEGRPGTRFTLTFPRDTSPVVT